MKTILGIDCGFAAPGFSIVADADFGVKGRILHAECFETSATSKKNREKIGKETGRKLYKSEDDARRMIEISDRIQQLVTLYNPALAVLELPHSGGKSASAVKGMAIASATAIVSLQRLNVPMQFITPYENKKGTTKDRNGEKELVLEAVKSIWPEYDGWPRMKTDKTRLDLFKCFAMSDSLSTIVTYLKLTPN